MSQTARDKTDQLVGKADDSLGHAAGIHDLAGKDEQGNGHQCERVAAGEDALGENDEILSVGQKINGTGNAHVKGNRDAKDQQDEKDCND